VTGGDPDQEVLEAASRWLNQGRTVVLFTVGRTWGSSPRPAGALLAVRDDGRMVGSVSGGCVEEHLVARCQAGEWRTSRVTGLAYGTDRAEADRFGLPCGGRLELVAETLDSARDLAPVLEALANRRRVTREVDLKSGAVSIHDLQQETAFHYDEHRLVRVFGPNWRVLIIGASQLSRYVARFAEPLGFEALVCDPRPEYADGFDWPEARLVPGMPDDAARGLARDDRCAVLALTHDPRLDDMALMQALQSDAFYVGAIGSRANQRARLGRLAQLGIDSQRLSALHGPIGLPIGSRTPAEIAVAIVAELVAVRQGAVGAARNAARAAVVGTPLRDPARIGC
jgi:xanthine dehydrogenase accessory factor